MEGYFGPIEHDEQLGAIGVKPFEQAIEHDEAGRAAEDTVEPRAQGRAPSRRGRLAIGFEVAIIIPDQAADTLLCGPVAIVESGELVNEALAVDPAQRMVADVKLAGIVADDDGVVEKAVRLDAAPQRAFGGDHRRVDRAGERLYAEQIEMRLPCPMIGEDAVGMVSQQADQREIERTVAHVCERHRFQCAGDSSAGQHPRAAAGHPARGEVEYPSDNPCGDSLHDDEFVGCE